MALFGRDYDRDMGYRGGMTNRGYDRTYRSGWSSQDRFSERNGRSRYEPAMDANRYDRGMGAAGYDRSYKSDWQTNHGDPFGDRAAHTPMRMIRGEYRSGYDRGFRGGYDRDDFRSERTHRYDRGQYGANPMGYDPYSGSGRQGGWMRDDVRRGRGYGRGYDTGWF